MILFKISVDYYAKKRDFLKFEVKKSQKRLIIGIEKTMRAKNDLTGAKMSQKLVENGKIFP